MCITYRKILEYVATFYGKIFQTASHSGSHLMNVLLISDGSDLLCSTTADGENYSLLSWLPQSVQGFIYTLSKCSAKKRKLIKRCVILNPSLNVLVILVSPKCYIILFSTNVKVYASEDIQLEYFIYQEPMCNLISNNGVLGSHLEKKYCWLFWEKMSKCEDYICFCHSAWKQTVWRWTHVQTRENKTSS